MEVTKQMSKPMEKPMGRPMGGPGGPMGRPPKRKINMNSLSRLIKMLMEAYPVLLPEL